MFVLKRKLPMSCVCDPAVREGASQERLLLCEASQSRVHPKSMKTALFHYNNPLTGDYNLNS